MEFETHITVKTTNIEQFKIDCSKIKVKPIVIEMENIGEQQVMTSSKHRTDSWLDITTDISNKLIELGYKIERIKVEKNPSDESDINFIYYESHLRVKFKKDNRNKEILSHILLKTGTHLSKNAFKNDNVYSYYMCTIREYNTSLSDFKQKVDEVKNEILKNKIFDIDKIEIEECIFDSNKSIDDMWLKTK